MNLAATRTLHDVAYIVDLDRSMDTADGPKPLFVARVYDDDVKRLLLAAPALYDALRQVLDVSGVRDVLENSAVGRDVLALAEGALKAGR